MTPWKAITVFILIFTIFSISNSQEVAQPRSGIQCYFGTGNGIQSSVTCPTYTSGCIKRTSCKDFPSFFCQISSFKVPKSISNLT